MNHLHRVRKPLLAAVVMFAVLAGLANQASALADGDYTITDGDTLSVIADNNDTTVETLVALNGITDPDLIFPGEVLTLPDSVTEDDEGDQYGARSTDAMNDEMADGSSDAVYDESADATDAVVWVDPPYVDQDTIIALLIDAAQMYGWDPSLILAQAWQESRWRQDGVSEAGAIGVMQVLPDTASGVGDWYLGREVDPWNNVWDNIESGVAYLTILYEETGSVDDALAAYYQGLGSLERDGMYDDTREYLDLIFGFQQKILDGDFWTGE